MNHKEDSDERFSCNICLDTVSEPVVTRCGHLFCWSCLYKWLEPGMTGEDDAYLSGEAGAGEGPRPGAGAGSRPGAGMLGVRRTNFNVNPSRRKCPVCKASCTVPTVIPIFVREDGKTKGDSSSSSKKQNDNEGSEERSDVMNHDHAVDIGAGIGISSQTGLRQRRRPHESRESEAERNEGQSSLVDQTEIEPEPEPETSPNEINHDNHNERLSPIPNRPQPPAPLDDPVASASAPASSTSPVRARGVYMRVGPDHMDNPLQRALFEAMYDLHRLNQQPRGAYDNINTPNNRPSLHQRNQNQHQHGNDSDRRNDDDSRPAQTGLMVMDDVTKDFLFKLLMVSCGLILLNLLML